MAISVNFYLSDIEIQEEHLNKLKQYFDDSATPTEISFFKEEIIEGTEKYKIFRVGKRIQNVYSTYKVEDDKIVPTEEKREEWASEWVYFRLNSKEIYVQGSSAGWVPNLISRIMFGDDAKINLLEIDTDKLEKDITERSKFKSTGVGFIEPDGTKVRLVNDTGLDLNTNKHVQGCQDITKEKITILIEKDDLNFNATIYSSGKVTLLTYNPNVSVLLRLFLKVWQEMKPYNS